MQNSDFRLLMLMALHYGNKIMKSDISLYTKNVIFHTRFMLTCIFFGLIHSHCKCLAESQIFALHEKEGQVKIVSVAINNMPQMHNLY